MRHLAVALLSSLWLGLAYSVFVPGRGCGTLTAIKTVEQRSVDFSNLEPCTNVKNKEASAEYKDWRKEFVYTPWSPCNVTCGPGGFRTRTRECRNRTDTFEPHECGSNKTELILPCYAQPCQENGSWSPWGAFEICNDLCIGVRRRTCDDPAPAGTGLDCQGEDYETGVCPDCSLNPACYFHSSNMNDQNIGDTVQPDINSCRANCLDNVACKAFIYHQTDNICYLKNVMEQLVALSWHFVAGKRTCGCLEDEVNYEGNEIGTVTGDVADAETCQWHCAQVQDCLYFSHNAVTSTCHMKSSDETKSPLNSMISGPKFCPCLESGFDYHGGDLPGNPVVNIADVMTCQELCVETDDCLFFSHNAQDTNCFLKNSNRRKVAIPGITSGPKFCPCFEVGINYVSGISLEGQPLTNVADVTTCQWRCTKTLDCLYFTYISATLECYLKASIGSREPVSSYDLAISGPRTCPCFEVGFDYTRQDVAGPDGEVGVAGVADAESCRLLCEQKDGCLFFTYTVSGVNAGICFLKDSKAGRMANTGVVSGPKVCP